MCRKRREEKLSREKENERGRGVDNVCTLVRTRETDATVETRGCASTDSARRGSEESKSSEAAAAAAGQLRKEGHLLTNANGQLFARPVDKLAPSGELEAIAETLTALTSYFPFSVGPLLGF